MEVMTKVVVDGFSDNRCVVAIFFAVMVIEERYKVIEEILADDIHGSRIVVMIDEFWIY